MRKILITLSILIMIFLVGCSNEKPEDTVTKFIEAGKELDLAAMSDMIKPTNESSKEEIQNLMQEGNDQSNQYESYFLDYLKENTSKITYSIAHSEIENSNATVTVDFKYVDGGPLLKATIGEVFTKVFAMAFSDEDFSDDDMDSIFVEAMKTQQELVEETFSEATVDINLVQIDGQWYIDEPSDALLDVFTSNFISIGEELNESLN